MADVLSNPIASSVMSEVKSLADDLANELVEERGEDIIDLTYTDIEDDWWTERGSADTELLFGAIKTSFFDVLHRKLATELKYQQELIEEQENF